MAKKPTNRLIRKAIREILEPAIRALGFDGKYPSFKRISKQEIHFLQVGTAKYGGSFSYTVAWCKNRPLIHWDETEIAPEAITVAHLPFENRHSVHRMIDAWRLDGTPIRCTAGGYDYSNMLEDEDACRGLVSECAVTLPQAEEWLQTRKPQDSLHPVGAIVETGVDAAHNAQIFINKEEHRQRMIGLIS